MKRALLLSIKPKYVAKILNGEKTIEIRKTMPKCDLPIDVYIYCTKDLKSGKQSLTWLNEKSFKQVKNITYEEKEILGKVVAKFTLNKVEEITPQMWTPKIEHEILEKSCLKENELFDYICSHDGTEDKPFYSWHISNLIIFDKPKELSEFYCAGKKKKCRTCKEHCRYYLYTNTLSGKPNSGCTRYKGLTKAPKSYQFIEGEDK